MPLQRRLLLAIIFLLTCLLAGNLLVTVHNARLNIYEQLQTHAQDTATALGFSISQAAMAKDTVQVSSMIDVIFDRGYYRRIIYKDLEGSTIVERESPARIAKVPNWFSRWLRLPEPKGAAVVSSGWFQLGEISVVSHPGFAYQDLWRSFKEQLVLFLVSVLICYGLVTFSLRFILWPLRRVEAQAEAIMQREFREQYPLPEIPELRQVVDAMNRMVVKVKTMFNHQVELNHRLHQQLRTDDVTGLSNRKDFNERFRAYLKSERTANTGVLMLVHLGDLHRINREEGRAAGDEYLHAKAQDVMERLKPYQQALISRHRGAEFALFIPAISEMESQQLMNNLYTDLQAGEWSGEKIQDVTIGAVYTANLRQSLQNKGLPLLAVADSALNSAQGEESSGCYWQLVNTESRQLVMGASEWLVLLNKALQKDVLIFRYQPVWQLVDGQKQLLFNELLTHLSFEDNNYPASVFMPMATRLQLMHFFDRKVLETVMSKGDLADSLCLNLSTAFVEDQDGIYALKQQLAANPELASRLVFELPANSLSFLEDEVRRFAEMINNYGARLSLHHFGRGTAEFAFMQSLPLDFLKIDRCFIQSITEDEDAQFFVRSLVTIAQSCDVVVLAEGVETEAQWEQLLELGIQGGQGYWLGEPKEQPQS